MIQENNNFTDGQNHDLRLAKKDKKQTQDLYDGQMNDSLIKSELNEMRKEMLAKITSLEKEVRKDYSSASMNAETQTDVVKSSKNVDQRHETSTQTSPDDCDVKDSLLLVSIDRKLNSLKRYVESIEDKLDQVINQTSHPVPLIHEASKKHCEQDSDRFIDERRAILYDKEDRLDILDRPNKHNFTTIKKPNERSPVMFEPYIKRERPLQRDFYDYEQDDRSETIPKRPKLIPIYNQYERFSRKQMVEFDNQRNSIPNMESSEVRGSISNMNNNSDRRVTISNVDRLENVTRKFPHSTHSTASMFDHTKSKIDISMNVTRSRSSPTLSTSRIVNFHPEDIAVDKHINFTNDDNDLYSESSAESDRYEWSHEHKSSAQSTGPPCSTEHGGPIDERLGSDNSQTAWLPSSLKDDPDPNRQPTSILDNPLKSNDERNTQINRESLTRNLVETTFSRYALAHSNVKGARGKFMLDPVKIAQIRYTVFKQFPAKNNEDEERIWRILTTKINTKCRGVKRLLKRKDKLSKPIRSDEYNLPPERHQKRLDDEHGN